jgi:hypothetical protein
VLRCPVAYLVNGKQHCSSYFVCNSHYHGVVHGGALAPATGGTCLQDPLPAPPRWFCTKEMRITP